MRYFFVESGALKKPSAIIEGSEARHIKNVLRLKPGDKIRVFDGEGFEYDARINAPSNCSRAGAIEGKENGSAAAPSLRARPDPLDPLHIRALGVEA